MGRGNGFRAALQARAMTDRQTACLPAGGNACSRMAMRFPSLDPGIFVLAALVAVECQHVSNAQTMPSGVILASKVIGDVAMESKGVRTALASETSVPVGARLMAAAGSSAMFVFSNGARLHLDASSEVVVDEFAQDRFAETIKLAELTEEPSVSRTRVRLVRGGMVGQVNRLHIDRGSTFLVDTPGGEVRSMQLERGSVFRVSFRPAGPGDLRLKLTANMGDLAYVPNDKARDAQACSIAQGKEVVVQVNVSAVGDK